MYNKERDLVKISTLFHQKCTQDFDDNTIKKAFDDENTIKKAFDDENTRKSILMMNKIYNESI